jgi:hypothetical protein
MLLEYPGPSPMTTITSALRATVTAKPTSTGRIYLIQLSDGRSFKRSSTKEKASAFCPIQGDGINLSIDAAKQVAEFTGKQYPGTVVNLQTGEVLYHRDTQGQPSAAQLAKEEARLARFRRRYGLPTA